MGDRRVAVCEATGKEVLQELVDGEWLCLHNDTDEEDAIEVDKFKQEKQND